MIKKATLHLGTFSADSSVFIATKKQPTGTQLEKIDTLNLDFTQKSKLSANYSTPTKLPYFYQKNFGLF